MATKSVTVKVDANGQYASRVRAVGKSTVPSKMCIRCEQIKPLTEFYSNAEWAQQSYRDCWCKDCAQKYVTDIDAAKEYCYSNNRHFDESYWTAAGEKAKYVLATNAEYINPKVSNRKKIAIRDACIGRQFLSLMNNKLYYSYEEHIGDDGVYVEESEPLVWQAADTGIDGADPSEKPITANSYEPAEKKTYDPVWRGYYTPTEIKQLEAEFEALSDDYVLDTGNAKDYARKVIKASWNADKRAEAYYSGTGSLKEYQDTMKIFDELSKSSAFATSKRRAGDSKGLGNLGEIIYRLELEGALTKDPYVWEEDQVDQVTHNYEHIVAALGAQGLLE